MTATLARMTGRQSQQCLIQPSYVHVVHTETVAGGYSWWLCEYELVTVVIQKLCKYELVTLVVQRLSLWLCAYELVTLVILWARDSGHCDSGHCDCGHCDWSSYELVTLVIQRANAMEHRPWTLRVYTACKYKQETRHCLLCVITRKSMQPVSFVYVGTTFGCLSGLSCLCERAEEKSTSLF